ASRIASVTLLATFVNAGAQTTRKIGMPIQSPRRDRRRAASFTSSPGCRTGGRGPGAARALRAFARRRGVAGGAAAARPRAGAGGGGGGEEGGSQGGGRDGGASTGSGGGGKTGGCNTASAGTQNGSGSDEEESVTGTPRASAGRRSYGRRCRPYERDSAQWT